MAISLYDAFVPACQQLMQAQAGMIDTAQNHAKEHGISDAEMLGAKLAADMWSLPWHVRACHVHSAFVIGLLPSGEFSPDFTKVPDSWDAMRAQVAETQESLAKVTAEELAEFEDKTIGFVLGGKRLLEATGSNFLLTISQPNFYFHATTFYDILRMKGVPLTKQSYLGMPRILGN